jgi:transcriptional repressor NrdR
MKCPTCGHGATIVTESQLTGRGVRRARECQQCGARFGTYEQPQMAMLMVRKRDGRREEFRRDKLLESLRLSARKRDLTHASLDAVVEDIEARLAVSGQAEVPSRVISEMAIGHLRMLDPIAYIRFASAYRHFVSLDDMLDELERLEYSPRPPVEQPALFPDDLPEVPTPIASAPSAAARR